MFDDMFLELFSYKLPVYGISLHSLMYVPDSDCLITCLSLKAQCVRFIIIYC